MKVKVYFTLMSGMLRLRMLYVIGILGRVCCAYFNFFPIFQHFDQCMCRVCSRGITCYSIKQLTQI